MFGSILHSLFAPAKDDKPKRTKEDVLMDNLKQGLGLSLIADVIDVIADITQDFMDT